MSAVRWLTGDVFERMAAIPDNSVDFLCTSPPFLALRSYLPDGHPDKAKEIGSEATPAAYLSTLLRLTREWRRILTPFGSIAVELGDTYSGSGGGGDNRESSNGGNDFAPRPPRSGRLANYTDNRGNPDGMRDTTFSGGNTRTGGGPGWPLPKSLCGIPHAYALSLEYGRNILRAPLTAHELLDFIDRAQDIGRMTTEDAIEHARQWMAEREDGDPDVVEPWRVRNLIVWHRTNPPVGQLGDKVRPSTSYITTACVSDKRWFDLDSERTTPTTGDRVMQQNPRERAPEDHRGSMFKDGLGYSNPAGAPPLDCWIDGDVWTIPTAPYKGAHYATYPPALPRRLIRLMCPMSVCVECGEPRRRIVENSVEYDQYRKKWVSGITDGKGAHSLTAGRDAETPTELRSGGRGGITAQHNTLGWSDCEHNNYRRGHVLDPFAGSGTTGQAAAEQGRNCTLIDLDERNLDLARQRCGMFLEEPV